MLGSQGMAGGFLTNDLLPRARSTTNAEFDITAMIDLVFMMNIYFLVTFITVALGEMDLPSANHCTPLDADTALTVTVVNGPGLDGVLVYLGNEGEGEAIADPAQQQRRIAAAVVQAADEGKTAVIFKAEKSIRLRDMARLCGAAAREGMTLHLGVKEKDTPQ